MKKLILDACTKTSFIFNNTFYEQRDGVSMGSPLGPVLANILMTEFENIVIKKFVDDGTIKFYGRYVDDTLILMKPTDIILVHDSVNHFDKNLRFTVDTFENVVPHFLDLELRNDGISLYKKATNIGLYVNFSSYVPWTFKTSWIRSLTSRTKNICSPNHPNSELQFLKRLASWNGFPKFFTNNIVKQVINGTNKTNQSTENTDSELTIWFRVPFCGDKNAQFANSCIRKIRRYCKKNINLKFRLLYDTTKLEFFCNNKDKTPFLSNSFVVYRFNCPGCAASYIGKTERTLHVRYIEHAWTDKSSAIYTHINECEGVRHINNIMFLDDSLNSDVSISEKDESDRNVNIVQSNTRIIDAHKNWKVLLIKEVLKIKELKPILNYALKALKALELF